MTTPTLTERVREMIALDFDDIVAGDASPTGAIGPLMDKLGPILEAAEEMCDGIFRHQYRTNRLSVTAKKFDAAVARLTP